MVSEKYDDREELVGVQVEVSVHNDEGRRFTAQHSFPNADPEDGEAIDRARTIAGLKAEQKRENAERWKLGDS